MSEYLKHSAQALNEAITRVRNNYRDCSPVDATADDVAVGKTIVDKLGGVVNGKLDVTVHYNEGYTKGEEAGYYTGYAEGEAAGDAAGFQRGYSEGLEDATPTLESKTVTPAAESQTVTPSDGFDGLASVVVEGDSDLIPENIKQGVTLFGVEGNAIANTDGMFCWAKFANGSDLLPNGYKEVEYLEANGTQVIDLGIVPTANTRITGKFRYTVSDNFFFGAESSWMNNSFDLLVSANVLTAIYGTTRTALGNFKNADFELDWNGNSVSVNGNVTTLSSATVSSGRPLYLFASNRGGSVVDKITGRVYSGLKIYADGSTLSGDFVTCIDDEDVPCIYNRVTGETLYDTGGSSFTTGAVYSSPTPDSYVLSDNLNAYPQDGYHTDGFYYKLLENSFVYDERGQYAWSKNNVEYADGEVSFPTSTLASLTPVTGGYSISSNGGGWGTSYLISEQIDLSKHKITFDFTLASTGSEKGIFFGVADTKATTYTSLNHSVYSHGQNAINHWRKGSQVANHGYISVGDKITMTVEGSTMSVYRNGTLLFTDTTISFTNAYVCVILYQSAVYGTMSCKMSNCPVYMPIGYVVGNEEDAYPNDAIADDGYWYRKVGATKVTPKYAEGTLTATNNSVTVTGLGFRPQTVCVNRANVYTAFGLCDENRKPKISWVAGTNGTYAYTATFTVTDDGFTMSYGNWAANQPVWWYATGY